MALNYQHTTRLQLQSLIKSLLGENTSAYWPDDEINLTINEALLTFGGLSGFWKENIEIHTEENQRLYDIFIDTVSVETKPTLFFQDILNWLNRDLIESISDTTPTSYLFDLVDLLKLIASKYNAFQLETNLVLSQSSQTVAAGNNLVILADNIIDLVRVVYSYNDEGDKEVILQKTDEQELAYFDTSVLTEENIPQYYANVYGQPNEIKLYPIPNLTGELKLILVEGINENSEILTTDIINLPNNLVPYLKYGVEESIFSKDGLLNDPGRADYCKKRWEEGISIGKIYTSILTIQANGVAINSDSLNNLDNFIDLDSLTQTDDPPSVLGLAGFNIFEIDTLPSTFVNSILVMIQQNAILPTDDNSVIQIEQSYIESLAKYCVHLLQFKSGIADIAATSSYLTEFQKLALSFNKRLELRGITFENLIQKTKNEEKQKPRLVEEVATQ